MVKDSATDGISLVSTTYQTFLLYLAAVLTGALAMFAYRRRNASGALPFAGLFLSMSVWSLAYAFEINSIPVDQQIIWMKFKFSGILLLPVTWLFFTFQYTGRKNQTSQRALSLAAIIPLVSLVLIWTNDHHQLYWQQIVQIPSESGYVLALEYGPAFWLFIAYSYLLICYCAWLLFRGLSDRYAKARTGAVAILISLAVPMVANVLSILPIFPSPRPDYTPFAFIVTGSVTLWMIIKLHFLDTLPIATQLIIDKMSEGVLVVDFRNQIIYANQAALSTIAKPSGEIVGQPVDHIIHKWKEFGTSTDLNSAIGSKGSVKWEISLNHGGAQSHHEIQISPLQDPNGFFSGHLITLRDITWRKQNEEALRRQLDELTILHSVATACVEAKREDVLIEQVTRIIGNTLYPDNFGLLLVDPETNLLHTHFSYQESDGIPGIPIPLGEGITGRVALEGKTWYVPDVSQEASYIETDAATKSELCVPLKVGERVVGVVNVESAQLEGFSPADERLLTIIAGQLSTAIERLRAEAGIQKRVQELQGITQISNEINSVLDSQKILDSIAHRAAEISACDACGIFTDRPDGRLYLVAAYGVGEEFIKILSSAGVPMDGTAVGHAYTKRRPYQIPDINEEKENYGTLEVASIERIRSILAIPMRRGNEVIGGIVLWHRKARRFTKEEERFLQALASQSVNALENARLFEQERQQRKLAEVLRESGTALSATLEFDIVLDRLLEQLALLVPYDAANVMMVENGHVRFARLHGYEQFGHSYLQGIMNLRMNIATTENLRIMLESRKPLIIPDVKSDQRWQDFVENTPVYSWAGAPILIKNEVVAFFGLDSIRKGTFLPEHSKPLEIFASQAGLALQNALLFEETRRRALQQEALNAVIATGVTAPDLPFLLNNVLDLTLHALGLDRGAIWVKEHSAIRGFPIDIGNESQHISQEQNEAGLQTTIAWNDIEEDAPRKTLEKWKVHFQKHQIRALLVVPVMASGERIGAISIASPNPWNWSQEDIALAQSVGRQVGSAAERLELVAISQEQARQIQQIINTVPEGVLVLDHNRRVLLANPAAQCYLDILVNGHSGNPNNGRILETPLEHLGGARIEELLKTDGEKTWREFQTENTPTQIFEIAVRPLETGSQGSGNHRAGWVMVLRDITLVREDQARVQMRERLATVGQLAAGIAHDFNNIMAAVVVYADLLSMEPGLSADGRERLKTIQQQTQRATALIRQILDFSRRSVLERGPLDLLPFIEELDKLLGHVLPETIQRKLHFQPGTYMVNADPTHLQQVFMNLALNARDAMPSGGILSITLTHIKSNKGDAPPLKELSPGSWICITIQDTGIGIPAEVLPYIFDPFFTTKPVGEGTGLGLAQVYGIIQQHGGVIDVQSREDGGTKFILYLPEYEYIDQPDRDNFPVNSRKGAGETLLLVEDDQAARKALEELLDSQGYKTLLANNGAEAKQIYESYTSKIDMIISDVVMPEMGGIELYSALTKEHPDTKFLLITGHPLDLKDQLPLNNGMVQWIYKPFSVHDFMTTLQSMLKKTSTAELSKIF